MLLPCQEFLFEEQEKEEFTRPLRKAAAYSGIEILTHVVMSKHYLNPVRAGLVKDPKD